MFHVLKMEKSLRIKAVEGNTIEVKNLLDRKVNADAVDPVSICSTVCMYLHFLNFKFHVLC